jgi:hypothetical protein
VLRYVVIKTIEEDSALRFENENYSKRNVKDHMDYSYNYTKGVIKDSVSALLPNRFRLLWDFLVDRFCDRFLLPTTFLKDALHHIVVSIMVINYLYYFSDRTLYCTIA